MTEFNDLVEKISDMSIANQAILIDIINKRFHEARREQIRQEIILGRDEYLQGKTKSGSVSQLMDEIMQ
ncbi:MAG: hypothetical protein HW421_897 [Ignavibacteria bacterium]|nr:hypothetical protein [Ignavibacteria bacterium]